MKFESDYRLRLTEQVSSTSLDTRCAGFTLKNHFPWGSPQLGHFQSLGFFSSCHSYKQDMEQFIS